MPDIKPSDKLLVPSLYGSDENFNRFRYSRVISKLLPVLIYLGLTEGIKDEYLGGEILKRLELKDRFGSLNTAYKGLLEDLSAIQRSLGVNGFSKQEINQSLLADCVLFVATGLHLPVWKQPDVVDAANKLNMVLSGTSQSKLSPRQQPTAPNDQRRPSGFSSGVGFDPMNVIGSKPPLADFKPVPDSHSTFILDNLKLFYEKFPKILEAIFDVFTESLPAEPKTPRPQAVEVLHDYLKKWGLLKEDGNSLHALDYLGRGIYDRLKIRKQFGLLTEPESVVLARMNDFLAENSANVNQDQSFVNSTLLAIAATLVVGRSINTPYNVGHETSADASMSERNPYMGYKLDLDTIHYSNYSNAGFDSLSLSREFKGTPGLPNPEEGLLGLNNNLFNGSYVLAGFTSVPMGLIH